MVFCKAEKRHKSDQVSEHPGNKPLQRYCCSEEVEREREQLHRQKSCKRAQANAVFPPRTQNTEHVATSKLQTDHHALLTMTHGHSGRNCWAVGSSPWAGPDRLFIEAQPMGPPSHINSARVRRRGSKVVARLGAKLESNDRNYLRVSSSVSTATEGLSRLSAAPLLAFGA
jgi:hypothetical protein